MEITLKPRRAARAQTIRLGDRRCRIEATFVVNDSPIDGIDYDHPVLTIFATHSGARVPGAEIVLTFQRSQAGRGRYTTHRRSSGFMGARGLWSTCYATNAEIRIGQVPPHFLARAIALLAAARAAANTIPALAKLGDPALAYVVGLRLLGTPIGVSTPVIRAICMHRLPSSGLDEEGTTAVLSIAD